MASDTDVPASLRRIEDLLLNGLISLPDLQTLASSTHAGLQSVASMAAAIVDGDYVRALATPAAQTVLEFTPPDAEDDEGGLPSLPLLTRLLVRSVTAGYLELAENKDDRLVRQLHVLLTGVACLSVFVQSNWTGPTLRTTPAPIAALAARLEAVAADPAAAKTAQRTLLNVLVVNGEDAFFRIDYAAYLIVARALLVDCLNALSLCDSAALWSARVTMIHQRVLDNPAEGLANHARAQYARAVATYQSRKESNPQLLGRIIVEQGLLEHYYKQTTPFQQKLEEARTATGLTYELTGALSVKTKFQQFKVATLIVDARSALTATESAKIVGEAPQPVLEPNALYADTKAARHEDMPVSVDLEETHLLQKPTFVEAINTANLAIVDQAILLGLCLDVENQNPRHGLTTEQMMPFVARVMENPNNWLVHSTALLLRSRLEATSYKHADRSTLQVRELVAQYDIDDDRTPASKRMDYVYCLEYPHRWALKRELGLMLLKYGAVVSALEQFEALEMYEDMVTCYLSVDKKKKAIELVQARLEVEPTPKMWTIMGDITDDVSCYEKSWNLAKQKGQSFSRARRAWAFALCRQEKWAEAIPHFEAALAINPMFPSSWFTYGAACMRTSQLDKGAHAYSRMLQLEPEDGEGWGNLAAIYMHQRKKKEAYHAMQEGLKHKRENWKMWQNFLYVCMDIGEFQQAAGAVEQLAQLSDNKLVDAEILGMLVHVFATERKEATPQAEPLRKRLLTMFHVLCNLTTVNPHIWSALHDFYAVADDKAMMLDSRIKECRALQVANWERNIATVRPMIEGTIKLCDLYVALGGAEHRHSAKLYVNSILGRVQAFHENSPEAKQVADLAAQFAAD